MRPYIYIDKDDRLRALIDVLFRAPRLALDTESNSLHAYREQVCLIQISTAENDYLVDPLAVSDLTPLAPVMADNRIEKIIHAAENDVMALRRDFNFTFVNVFDTMAAARICGYKTVGLSPLLERHFSVRLDKSHQLDDWGARPLAHDSLMYAQMDAHYLGALRDKLASELTRLGRCSEAWETFADLCMVAPTDSRFDSEGYWRIALPIQLNARQTAVLRELYLLRDQIARARNLPVFRVLQDKTLASLARKAPQTPDDLLNVSDMPISLVDEYGIELLDAIASGLHAKPPPPPPLQPSAEPLIVDRYTALRDWRRAKANERGVETDVIISKEALWEIATRNPTLVEDMRDIRMFGEWRIKTYAEDILGVLARFRR